MPIDTETNQGGHFYGKLCPSIYKGDYAAWITKKGYFTVRPAFTMKSNGKVSLRTRMEKIPLLSKQDLDYRAKNYEYPLKPKHNSGLKEGISGTVTDTAGHPIANVYIRIDPEFPQDQINIKDGSPQHINIQTDKNGFYQQDLPPGVYTVNARKQEDVFENNFYSDNKQLLIKPGKISTLDFALEKYRYILFKGSNHHQPIIKEVEVTP